MGDDRRRSGPSAARKSPRLDSPPIDRRGLKRSALLAGASLIAIAALAAPGSARAACTGANQDFTGPITSTGGAITVSMSGSIQGGPTGIDASVCAVTALTNSGAINGGVGPTGALVGGAGGVAVLVGAGVDVGQLTNQLSGAIGGGAGGYCTYTGGAGGRLSRTPGRSRR
jgi:hypothetical protein